MLTLFVFAPPEAAAPGAPTGLIFTQELFRAYRLKSGQAETLLADLPRRLAYLQNRYPGRVRVRWVDPWSPGGLWMAWRLRVRAIPSVAVEKGPLLAGETLKDLEDIVAERLSTVPPSNTTGE